MDYFDRQGNPITLDQWSQKLMDPEYKIIRKTKVGSHDVSTVWLGLNHSFGFGGKLIFETMVFPECDDMERYGTEEQAIAGHEAMVKKYK